MDVKKFGETVEGVAFLQGSGFRQKVETGSHIKNDGYHLMGGAGIRYHEDQGNLLATVFIEHGDGDYDTYHQSIHGKGDFSYTGAGLYAKQTWDNGWFIDGSGRGGRVKRDFKSGDIVNGRFDDKSSNYYGFHIGGGKELEISPDNKLTLNGRLLWTRIEDFTTVTKADEHLGFDSANSVRTHLGARVDHKITQEAKLYAGAAWEQELDGEIEGKLDSYRVDKPDFSGASAVFEVGGKYEQNQGMQGWVANAGVKGVAGKRDEISGKVGIGYRW
ncbi:autotransporter outer membrane beta-barrel domain-containing protein [Bartonella apihabitans]|nr:autotransporter outer membrane beta-barrel domain-containing protein [Bartonella apihabitans]WLT08665.1 autotransporter outer membrane beta-barrel domain-containing protein [Bartonella apihabitans]